MDMREEHHYAYEGGKHLLEISIPKPSLKLIDAVRHGVFEFAIYDHREVLLFCYRIKGAIEWKSIPYNVHFAKGDEVVLPQYPFCFSEKINLKVTLLDCKTEEVKARRTVKFSRNFSLELVSALRRQAAFTFSQDNFVMTQTAISTKHRAIEDVVENATVRCMGEWSASNTQMTA